MGVRLVVSFAARSQPPCWAARPDTEASRHITCPAPLQLGEGTKSFSPAEPSVAAWLLWYAIVATWLLLLARVVRQLRIEL